MLYKKEIAELYGLKSKTSAIVLSQIFIEYSEASGVAIPEIYYFTKYTNRVFPAEFYDAAIKWFVSHYGIRQDQEVSILHNGRKYRFSFGSPQKASGLNI
jgi:hypothetical protein